MLTVHICEQRCRGLCRDARVAPIDLFEFVEQAAHIGLIESRLAGGQHALKECSQVRQITMNVIINAIQAILRKGEIKIKTESALLKGEPAIKLMIEDSGIGITEEDFSQIFDPFFSTKERGSGLGLSIVYKLVEGHQGEIKVESKEGKGTKFVIFLPQKGGK